MNLILQHTVGATATAVESTMEKILKNTKTGFVNQTGVNIIWWDLAHSLSDWNYSNSCGKFWRLYWNATPGGEISSNAITHALDSSQVVLIPPLFSFSTRNSESFCHLSIHFTAPDYLTKIKRKFYFFPTSQPPFDELPQLIRLICQTDIPKEWKMMSLYELIYEAVRLFNPHQIERQVRKLPADYRMLRAAEMICENPAVPLDNKELSRRLGISVSTFVRAFKSEFGMSPQHYSRIMRVEVARTILWRPECTLDEVAAATGFADRYHFSKVFKLIAHCTPAQFRKYNSAAISVSGAHIE